MAKGLPLSTRCRRQAANQGLEPADVIVKRIADGPLQERGDVGIEVGALLSQRIDGHRQNGGELLQAVDDILKLRAERPARSIHHDSPLP